MNRTVFLDTSGWVAAAVRGQSRHEQVKAAYATAIRQGYRILTTAMVMGESHVLFARLLGRQTALSAMEGALSDPTHVVVTVDDELVRAAADAWVKPCRDQLFSLCGAVSFEVMRREESGAPWPSTPTSPRPASRSSSPVRMRLALERPI